MLCVPIVSINSGNVIAVACVFNKTLPEKRYTIHRNVDFYVITVSVIAFFVVLDYEKFFPHYFEKV